MTTACGTTSHCWRCCSRGQPGWQHQTPPHAAAPTQPAMAAAARQSGDRATLEQQQLQQRQHGSIAAADNGMGQLQRQQHSAAASADSTRQLSSAALMGIDAGAASSDDVSMADSGSKAGGAWSASRAQAFRQRHSQSVANGDVRDGAAVADSFGTANGVTPSTTAGDGTVVNGNALSIAAVGGGTPGGCGWPPPLLVANTHVLFNPKRGDVKVSSEFVVLS